MPTRNNPSSADTGTGWPSHYTAQDLVMIGEILSWLGMAPNLPVSDGFPEKLADLPALAGVSAEILQAIFAGHHPKSPARTLKQLLKKINAGAAKNNGAVIIPQVSTSVLTLISWVCHRAQAQRDFGIVAGAVGVGKTLALRHYAAKNPAVVLIDGTPDMTPVLFLRELVESTAAAVRTRARDSRGTKEELLRAVVRSLRSTPRLIILDEADKVSDATLEYLRRISDLAEAGVVLAGTERLRPMVQDPQGRHGQISSRVGFWPPVIRAITENDANKLVAAAFEGRDAGPDAAVHNAFWQMCDGKARVLVKLIRNVIQLGMEQGYALTPQLVFEAGQQLMGLKRARGQ